MIFCARFFRTHYYIIFDYLSNPSEIQLEVRKDRGEISFCKQDVPDPALILACDEDTCILVVISGGAAVDISSAGAPASHEELEEEERANASKIHRWWLTRKDELLKK
ncbi:MAG: hypothetical protein QXI64_10420 [Sulfolobales archaeon]